MDQAVVPVDDAAQWKRSLSKPVRIQWDPERDLRLRPLPHRAIQIGLARQIVDRYVDEWIISIDDITAACHEIHGLVQAGDLTAAARRLPAERPYPGVTTPRLDPSWDEGAERRPRTFG